MKLNIGLARGLIVSILFIVFLNINVTIRIAENESILIPETIAINFFLLLMTIVVFILLRMFNKKGHRTSEEIKALILSTRTRFKSKELSIAEDGIVFSGLLNRKIRKRWDVIRTIRYHRNTLSFWFGRNPFGRMCATQIWGIDYYMRDIAQAIKFNLSEDVWKGAAEWVNDQLTRT